MLRGFMRDNLVKRIFETKEIGSKKKKTKKDLEARREKKNGEIR